MLRVRLYVRMMMDNYEELLDEVERTIMRGDAGYDEFATATLVIKLVEQHFKEEQENVEYERRDNKTYEIKERFRELFSENYMAFMRDEYGDGIGEVMWMAFAHGFFADEDKR